MTTDASHEQSPSRLVDEQDGAEQNGVEQDSLERDDAGPDSDDLVLVEEVEAELVLPVWEATGDPRVDAALDLLTTLDPDDVSAHAEVFDAVHQQLREALTDLDSTTA